MPNNDLFTNDVMTFWLPKSYYIRTTVLCSCHVSYVWTTKLVWICLPFVCIWMNMWRASYPHVNIANTMKRLNGMMYELIGTTFIYAIVVYLITDTFPHLNISIYVSCWIDVTSYQPVSNICLYINKYNNTCPIMTYLQMMWWGFD